MRWRTFHLFSSHVLATFSEVRIFVSFPYFLCISCFSSFIEFWNFLYMFSIWALLSKTYTADTCVCLLSFCMWYFLMNSPNLSIFSSLDTACMSYLVSFPPSNHGSILVCYFGEVLLSLSSILWFIIRLKLFFLWCNLEVHCHPFMYLTQFI